MSEKRAGGIFLSSFVAGLLLTAAVFAPRAWETVPGPYFGLDDSPPTHAPAERDIDARMEAAHAELSARAATPVSPPPAVAVFQPAVEQVPPAVPALPPAGPAIPPSVPTPPTAALVPQPTFVPPPAVMPAPPETVVTVPATPPEMGPQHTASTTVGGPPGDAGPGTPPRTTPPWSPVGKAPPPERVAVANPEGPAAAAALASILPSSATAPAAESHESSAPAAPPPQTARQQPPQPMEELQPAFNAMMQRVQTVQPPAPQPALAPSLPAPTSAQPQPRSWTQVLSQPQAPVITSGPPATPPAQPGHAAVDAAPLPGEAWSDPDGVNWSDVIASPPPVEVDKRRSLLGDRRQESRGAGVAASGRLLDRLRGTDRRSASGPAASALPVDQSPPDISRWPRPAKLEQQLDHVAGLGLSAGAGGTAIGRWTDQTRFALLAVQDTRGPRDAAADATLVALGETVVTGMTLAESTVDATLATHTRRAALAVARRAAVWRAAATFFRALGRLPPESDSGGSSDAAAAMTRQAAGRTVVEVARLLDALERFEASGVAADAAVVRNSLTAIAAFYPSASKPVARAVEDHYNAPNMRIAVHQRLLQSLLPAATIDTAPFHDTVLGRDVRGTRTVERTTSLRLIPDDDEICFDLEVHGDIAARAVTDAGPVSVTSRSASAFLVRKPMKVSSQGLLFGAAVGAGSNRSHVDNVQTSFDSVPVMGSIVRNFARNQQAEAMPEANREAVDKIVSRACREVDRQSEPQFAQLSDRIRERFWMPLVRLGLEPTAVAMQTTDTVATIRLRLAGDTQLAAHTPRPRAPAQALLSLQVQESSANNACDGLGIAGRRFTLEELVELVCVRVGVDPRAPDDLPEGVAVTFAPTQPLRVDCRDGLVHVHVDLDAIESGRRDWHDIAAHVAYRPVCSGAQVYLEREGPIQLGGPGHEGRMELALRTIFGKIFPKERKIPLLPPRIAENERLPGLQAVQAVSSDGWLAITLEETRATVAPKAPPAAAPQARRRTVFR